MLYPTLTALFGDNLVGIKEQLHGRPMVEPVEEHQCEWGE